MIKETQKKGDIIVIETGKEQEKGDDDTKKQFTFILY